MSRRVHSKDVNRTAHIQLYGKLNKVGVFFPLEPILSLCGAPVSLERLEPLKPNVAATLPHPFHANRLFAAISPKPSITPLMKGRTRLMAKLLAKARNLALLDKVVSNIDSVID